MTLNSAKTVESFKNEEKIVLVLNNEEIETILTMEDCIRALEDAYRDLGENKALVSPRIDCLSPCGRDDAHYAFKQMGGTWPRKKIQALRIGSDIIAYRKTGNIVRQDKLPLADGRFVGLIELFSTETGELLAIFPDGLVQTYRVGAANGIAIKYLAPEKVRTVGLIGAGFQARMQLKAALAVRNIEKVKVYSLRPESRNAFVRHWSAFYNVEMTAVDTPEECIRDVDIIMSATSSVRPIIRPEWIKPGLFVSCIKKQEMDPAVFPLCDRVVVHHKRQKKQEDYIMPGTPNVAEEQHGGWWTDNKVDWNNFIDLPTLIRDSSIARRNTSETLCFVNNLGLGLQFAAVGSVVLEKASELSLGKTLPNDWFTQSIRS